MSKSLFLDLDNTESHAQLTKREVNTFLKQSLKKISKNYI